VKASELPIRTKASAASILALALLATVALVAGPALASGAPRADVIVLPGAKSAEGIAVGPGDTFYAGDLVRGDIFRGSLKRGTAEMFIDVPDGQMAVGMAVDLAHHLLFVAGGPGKAYVYNTSTGSTVATYQFADPAASIVNDVAITSRGAWFTDSKQAKLYFVPISAAGKPGSFRTLAITGPASDISGAFNLNGIQAISDGNRLIVGHSTTGRLYKVDPTTGVSVAIAGVSLPNVDGIVLQGRRLWAVQNAQNQVSEIQLSRHLDAGVVTKVTTDKRFQSPTSAARYGNQLAVVQGKNDTGFPPTADQYEVVLVPV
jgi:sugar lactone lactonase YvrE